MSDVPEWDTADAVEAVAEILGDNIAEEALSDDDVQKVAALIVKRLEEGPK